MSLNPSHVAWCRNMVDMLNGGGMWCIPRSGLVFTKTGPDELTLTARMPWVRDMSITEQQLHEQQQAELEQTTEHMLAAGVTVIDGTVTQHEEA